jgi:hypothetical protein
MTRGLFLIKKKNNIDDPPFIGLVSNDSLVARKSALVFLLKKLILACFYSKHLETP